MILSLFVACLLLPSGAPQRPVLGSGNAAASDELDVLELLDIFQLEYASEPRFSPDGEHIVYIRNSMDVMEDRKRSHLWLLATEGSDHRPLFVEEAEASHPRWSPSGDRLLFVSSKAGSSQLYLRWMDTGQTARLTQTDENPRSLSWSPDGRWIALTMHVDSPTEPFVKLPAKPEGAEWAAPAKVITELRYRSDGKGYLEAGHTQLFIVPADGGTPRQLTEGPFDVSGTPQWAADGKRIYFTSNRREDAEYDPLNSEIYALDPADGSIVALTSRTGPDNDPRISPDGRWIAYLGFDDAQQGYQVTRLSVMQTDGSAARVLTTGLDRSVSQPRWSADGAAIFFLYDDHGDTKIGVTDLEGRVETLVDSVGGLSLGRPYAGANYDVARNGRIAYTQASVHRPAELALYSGGDAGKVRRLTQLNEDLLGHKTLGEVEELSFKSAFDKRALQGWLVKPPGFDPSRNYPLLLEIHGGPFANYGPRFAAEPQLFAAAGHVVFYMNPRGSTGYGGEFGNLIHHAYPGHDYDDLMSGVDACLELGFIDPERLFVTGGSGGGVLTAWIVGKTNRFRAAVVAKPVINWTSFALTADAYNFFVRYWFPGFPWDYPEHYFKRSPLSLVGNVETPTMILTGEEDFRTPISESEQYYQALKLRKIDSALVRIPGASHGIASRPSHLISKVAHILEWFERHAKDRGGDL